MSTSSALQLSLFAGASTSAAGASTSLPVTTAPTSLPSSVSNTITVVLDRTNFLLWKTQVVPHIAGQGLHGFLDGSCSAPPATITTGTGAEAKTVQNPDFAMWWYTDQRVLSILLGSMHIDILARDGWPHHRRLGLGRSHLYVRRLKPHWSPSDSFVSLDR